MKFLDILRSASRNLRRQKLRSTLTMFAIVVGALAVTVMLALVTSAQGFLTTSYEQTGEIRRIIVTGQPGLSYRDSMWANPDGSGTKLTDATVAAVAEVPGVAHLTATASQGLWSEADAGKGRVNLKNIQMMGYDPNGTIHHEVLAGADLQPSDGTDGVVVTQQLAALLGYQGAYDQLVGKTVTWYPRPDMAQGMNLQPTVATVRGVVAGEDRAVYLTLGWLKALTTFTRQFPEGDGRVKTETEDWIGRSGYSSIYVDAASEGQVDEVARRIASLGLGLGAASAKDEVASQQQVFMIIGAVLGGLGGIALFVAALGVINTMVMATLERTREIGIMRAIGATRATVRRLFTVEAGLLGFLGGLVGVALSFGVMLGLNSMLNDQLASNGLTSRNVLSVQPLLALVVIAVTTGIGMVAGLLPAQRAARMDPVEALRHD